MSMSVTVTIDPGKLARFMHDPSGPVMGYLARVGNQISNASAVLCPVDTGYLRSTREVSIDPAAATVTVAYRANYARFVHDGTRYVPARPYLTDAMRQVLGSA